MSLGINVYSVPRFTSRMKQDSAKILVRNITMCSHCGKVIEEEVTQSTKLWFNVKRMGDPKRFYTKFVEGELRYYCEAKVHHKNCLLG